MWILCLYFVFLICVFKKYVLMPYVLSFYGFVFFLTHFLGYVFSRNVFNISFRCSLARYMARVLILPHSYCSSLLPFQTFWNRWSPCLDISSPVCAGLRLKMAEGNSNEEVIHLNNFHCHRGQGKLFALTLSLSLWLFLLVSQLYLLKWSYFVPFRIQGHFILRRKKTS